MRLRTFTAPDMPTAMQMVRDTMGDSAIILASEPHKGKAGISVTAALDGKEEPILSSLPKAASIPKSNAETDQLRFEVNNILRFHNLPELYVAKMMQQYSGKELSSIWA